MDRVSVYLTLGKVKGIGYKTLCSISPEEIDGAVGIADIFDMYLQLRENRSVLL